MVDLNQLLQAARAGDPQAEAQLTQLLYDELRGLARRALSRERAEHTLQPTALVHEAFLRLLGDQAPAFADRESFFAAAATTLRRVLVDHARRRGRDKRGGGLLRVPLEGLELPAPLVDQDLLALDEALEELARFDATKARLIELRFFAGLTLEQLSQAMGTSVSTLQREWRLARAWLRERLEGGHAG
jgi:RNA polymerase sigma factor (TIGR02999 family)